MSEIAQLIVERDSKQQAEARSVKEASGDAAATDTRRVDIDSLRLKGNDLLKKGEVAEAIKAYHQCLDLDPENVPVHSNLALAKVRSCDSSYLLQIGLQHAV